MIYPSEDWEQTQLVLWLDENNYKFSSIPSSTFTRSWSQKAKNTRTGLRKGLPDLLIVLKRKRLLFLEMKKVKGGKLSPEQKEWIETLNLCRVYATVAKGLEEAKKEIERYENLVD